jgi:hypothetical protein
MRHLIADAGYAPIQRRTLYDACRDACCRAPIPVPRPPSSGLPVHGEALDASVASA